MTSDAGSIGEARRFGGRSPLISHRGGAHRGWTRPLSANTLFTDTCGRRQEPLCRFREGAMDRMLLAAMDAVEQAALVASGAASPAELVAAALERAAAVEPQIHAIAALDAEGAKQRAMAVSGP